MSERLGYIRELHGGVSQNELGLRAGIKPGPMSRLVSRPRPSSDKLAAIATAWKVDLLWLATGEGEPRSAGAQSEADPDALRDALLANPNRWPGYVVLQARHLPLASDLNVNEWVDYLDSLRREGRRIVFELEARRAR